MQMDDKVAHMGIVDGLLRLALPGGQRRLIVGKDADDIELVEIRNSLLFSDFNSPPNTRCNSCFLPSSSDMTDPEPLARTCMWV